MAKKTYEGKLGVGQVIFCLFAFATLLIPFAFDPELSFTFNYVMPIGDNAIIEHQTLFINALLGAFGIESVIPEIVTTLLPYAIYAFYAIVAYDFLFIIILMIIRVEGLRKFFRFFAVLFGIVTLLVAIVALASVIGFFVYFMADGYGSGAPIFDCIKNEGVFFFAGVLIFAIIATAKQFTSFFGKY